MTQVVRRTALLAAAGLPWSWYAVRDLSPMLDWAAILLPGLLAGAVGLSVALAAALRRRWPLAVALSCTLVGVGAVVGPWSPAPTGRPAGPLTVAAANIRGDNPSSDAVADDVGVWSDLPLEDRGPPVPADVPGARGTWVEVAAPQGPFVLYGLHLFRPSRHAFENELTMPDHRALVETVAESAEREQLPVVITGDLNLTDRGSAFRRLRADRVDALRSSWTGPTSLRARNRPWLLRIDHLLLPSDWCARAGDRRALTGSDHRAVLADVGPCQG